MTNAAPFPHRLRGISPCRYAHPTDRANAAGLRQIPSFDSLLPQLSNLLARAGAGPPVAVESDRLLALWKKVATGDGARSQLTSSTGVSTLASASTGQERGRKPARRKAYSPENRSGVVRWITALPSSRVTT